MSGTGFAPASGSYAWAERSDGCSPPVWAIDTTTRRRRRIAEAERVRRDGKRSLRVGSWPGPSYDHNEFVAVFCAALRGAGADVVDVVDPRRIDPTALDVLHIHWPEQVFWRGLGAIKTIALLLAVLHAIGRLRAHGVVIVWMVHNLRPHDVSRLSDLVLWRVCVVWLRRLVDGFVTLSPATVDIVMRRMGFARGLPSISVRHPHYVVPDALQDRQAARIEARTGNPRRLIVSVGHVKRYKGYEALARAVAKGDDGTILVIAGSCSDEELAATLRFIAAQAKGKIDLRLERQSDAAFATLARAADYVVLPFTDYLHSGSIVHALSLGSRVLTPNNPYAADLAAVVGEQWVRTYDGEISWPILGALLDLGEGKPDLGALEPALMGRAMVDFYERLRAMS